MERVGVEGSLELWTLERDHRRYVTLERDHRRYVSLGRGHGRPVFSLASFEAMQVTTGGKNLPGKWPRGAEWWGFSLPGSAQDSLPACAPCPSLAP